MYKTKQKRAESEQVLSKLCFYMHDDLTTLVLSFLWNLTACELRQDLKFYIQWHKVVPPIFLAGSLLREDFWYEVANPLCEHNPYTPRKILSMRPNDIWGFNLVALGSMICRSRVRETRTYKRCAMRWINDCVCSNDLHYYRELHEKLLSRLKIYHFQSRAPLPFLQAVFSQLEIYTPASVDAEFLPSPLPKSQTQLS